jgi:KDO2-lipid IV(A) lauroyltransferase
MPPALFAPHHWPTWLGFALLRALITLPRGARLACGHALGRLLFVFGRARRGIAGVNLALCFPTHSAAERRALLMRHFENLGIALLETALCWWGRDAQLDGLADMEGIEHLHAARARGRGVLLLTAHFTPFELAGRLLARVAPFHVVYRPHKNVLLEYVMRSARERLFERAIDRRDARGLMKSLRQGHVVWYAPDQNEDRAHSVFAPFFGVPAATLTTTARIAAVSGAAVVPYFPRRLPDGRYHLHLLPALVSFPGGNAEADAGRINALFEQAIAAAPEQYLWVHRRFKTRPPGLQSVYTG